MEIGNREKELIIHTGGLPIEKIVEGSDDEIDDLIDLILKFFYESDAYKQIDHEYRRIQGLGKKAGKIQLKGRNMIINLFKSKEKEEKLLTQEEVSEKLKELNMQEAYALCDFVLSKEGGERDYTRTELLIAVISTYMMRQGAVGNTYLDFCDMAKRLDGMGEAAKATFIKAVSTESFSRIRSKRVTLVVDKKAKKIDVVDVNDNVVGSRSQGSGRIPTE